MKTGTSYLQRLMASHREALADVGYLFPGASWADHGLATRDVLTPTLEQPPRPVPAGPWQRLAAEMLAHRGAGSVLSHEFLSFASAGQARRIVECFPDRDVRVILTVRDAAGVIPAQWQTNCRNGGTLPFAGFIRGIERALEGSPDAGRPARLFQRTQGLPRMLDAWVPVVGADRVHVVTVPPRGSPADLLSHRFASVLGLDAGVCASSVDYVNTSLGYPSSELLRRVNRQLGRFDRAAYNVVVKSGLARHVLSTRSQVERPIRLHRSGLHTAARWNHGIRSAIETAGVQVVGDLEDLPTAAPGADAPEKLARPGPQELVDAAAAAREGLLRLHPSLSRGERRIPSQEHAAGSAEVREAIREVTSLVLACFALEASDPEGTADVSAGAPDNDPQESRAE